MSLESRLKPTWDWVLNVMDSTEAALRFGASLTHSTDPSHPLHPLHLNSAPPQATTTGSLSGLNVLGGGNTGGGAQSRTRLIDSSGAGSRSLLSGGAGGGSNSGTDNQRNFDRDTYAQSSRRDFLTYALSLMRSHSSEHRDSLPVLDITALRHIAYVVDGIVYYMRSGTDNDKSDSNSWTDADENENDDSEYEIQMNCDSESIDDELSNVSGSRHTFFQRSESTLCLGCPPPDSFSLAIAEALPLADQPHLLHPNASREDLFGIPKQPDTLHPPAAATNSAAGPPRMPSPLELPPTHLGMSTSTRMQQLYGNESTSKDDGAGDVTLQNHDEQSIIDASEERSEQKVKVTEQADSAVAKPSTSPSTANLAGAGTSSSSLLSAKEQTPTRQAPEGYNIYMQLKKKTYFDFYENDKRTDTPQDLSTSKTSSASGGGGSSGEPHPAKVAKLEIDGDIEMADAVENDTRSASAFDISQQSGSNDTATVRPQIIVSPRKSSAFVKTLKSENVSVNDTAGGGESSSFASLAQQSESNSSASNTSSASDTVGGQSASGSPSKSVIVRVGSSASLVSVDHFLSFSSQTIG